MSSRKTVLFPMKRQIKLGCGYSTVWSHDTCMSCCSCKGLHFPRSAPDTLAGANRHSPQGFEGTRLCVGNSRVSGQPSREGWGVGKARLVEKHSGLATLLETGITCRWLWKLLHMFCSGINGERWSSAYRGLTTFIPQSQVRWMEGVNSAT